MLDNSSAAHSFTPTALTRHQLRPRGEIAQQQPQQRLLSIGASRSARSMPPTRLHLPPAVPLCRAAPRIVPPPLRPEATNSCCSSTPAQDDSGRVRDIKTTSPRQSHAPPKIGVAKHGQMDPLVSPQASSPPTPCRPGQVRLPTRQGYSPGSSNRRSRRTALSGPPRSPTLQRTEGHGRPGGDSCQLGHEERSPGPRSVAASHVLPICTVYRAVQGVLPHACCTARCRCCCGCAAVEQGGVAPTPCAPSHWR